jgi:glycosyltransferase involved in cell wall biosynthesis
LKSAAWVDEIIVVDSGSTDRTVEIVKQHGAKVFEEAWQGFGPTKRAAVAHASHDWILSLDADEAMSEELTRELQSMSMASDIDGYRIPRRSFHLGRWINHGGWYPDFQLRLFNRRTANWNGAVVHEKVEAQHVADLRAPILHWVFRDISHQVQTNDRYSGLAARELHARRKRFSIVKLLVKPMSKFFETYFYKQGFRDGLPGFIIAVGAAYSVFLKWSKLWEIERSAPADSDR